MELITVQITNFRSVQDSETFTVGSVTCLVGKNEAGKSAILLALAALNPHGATPAMLDKERDYPRRSLTQYKERHPDKDAVAVTTWWQLSDDEMEDIAGVVGDDVLDTNQVTLTRRYDQAIEFGFNVDYATALEVLYSKYGLDESERSVISAAETTTQLISLMKNITSPTARHQELNKDLVDNGTITSRITNLLVKLLPKFMYFSSYDRMAGAVQLEETKKLIASGEIKLDQHRATRLFAEFLDYAGVSINDISNVATYETFNAKLQAASNNITDQILEYWTQNPDLSVAVRIESARAGDAAPLNTGTIARARIDNGLHRVDTPFAERSAGFVWFFSFLVKFAQVKQGTSPVILLLDEPGLTLHGKAQADLLRFFKEKLAPHHQIIYSTHSPFMVPSSDLESVRIVEDQIEIRGTRRYPLGTKVRDNILSRDPDTLFPLQGALGYEITQSLFVGKNTLLVEGPSDILYIQVLSDALRRRRRGGLDLPWTLCPAGGIDKIRPFVSLFAGNALNIAVLSDQANGDRRKIEDMKRSAVLAAGRFRTVADFLQRAEADIEDIFEPDLYVTILNSAYNLKDSLVLTVERLRSADKTTERLVKQTEAAFNLLPDAIPTFDHFTPASWLLRNCQILEERSDSVDKTLERAESIFSAFNDLLM